MFQDDNQSSANQTHHVHHQPQNFGGTMVQTINNPDGTVSIIQIDAAPQSIVTLPDGTQATVVQCVSSYRLQIIELHSTYLSVHCSVYHHYNLITFSIFNFKFKWSYILIYISNLWTIEIFNLFSQGESDFCFSCRRIKYHIFMNKSMIIYSIYPI